jgi:hypothetical protein
MAKAAKKKSAKETSENFHDIMKASMTMPLKSKEEKRRKEKIKPTL